MTSSPRVLAAAPTPTGGDNAGRLTRLLLWAAGLLAALALLASAYALQRGRAAAADSLQSVAALRQAQAEAWLREATGLARLVSSSRSRQRLFLSWLEQSDAAALQMLFERLDEVRSAADVDNLILLDPDGQAVARPGQPAETLPPRLREVALAALVAGETRHTGIYRPQPDRPDLRLDVVAPFDMPDRQRRGAVVLRQNPRHELFAALERWPVPSASGETMLWQQHGAVALAQSDLRHEPDAAGRTTRPIEADRLPGSALSGELPPRRVFATLDYRGQPVLATARRLNGTDWVLVVKLDRREVDAPAWLTIGWIAGLSATLMLAIGFGARALVRGQALERAESERERQARQLQDLQLLQAIADNSADAIFAKDLQGRYLFYNRTAAAVAGRDAASVIGQSDDVLFPATEAAQVRVNDALVLREQRQQTFEEVFGSGDDTRVFLVTKGPLRDTDQQLVGLFGVSRDITEQRRAEQALRASEAHHRSVIDVLSEGVVVYDTRGHVISGNPAAERLLGLPAGALATGTANTAGWVLLGDDGQPLASRALPVAQVLAGGRPVHGVELRAHHPDGRSRWFSINAQPVYEGTGGRMRAVVASFTDVTDRHRMLAEIAQHQQQLQQRVDERTAELSTANTQLAEAVHLARQVADNIPGRVAYWDHELRCRFANRAYYDWFGRTPEQVIGRLASEIVGADYLAPYRARLDLAFQGQSQQFERETLRPDGRRFVHQVHYLPDQDTSGHVHGVFVLAFDITALKDAEAELLLSRDRAEAANRAKSAFLANMSHEIRTPMNAIIGMAHLVQRDSRDPSQHERMVKIGHAAQHLLQIINDVLDLSKIEADRLELELAPFSLDAVIGRSFEMVAERARDKGLELIVDTDHLPDRLVGDATRLQQALLNLLSNAVKFTDQGWVRLASERLQVDGSRLKARFSVQDTGPGIPFERQSSLFTAFEQLDNSTSRRFGGTGLGLALTKRLAALMGGEVGVHSVPGEGSRFWFTAWLRADAEPAREQPQLSGRRVLLVDDLPEARASIADRLREFGLHVDEADSGEQALARVERAWLEGRGQVYDALLIDWRMAPMDGIQTLNRLRSLLGDTLPPAILVTAHDDDSLRQQARQARFARVLVKPVTASTLHDALLQLLDSPRPVAAPVHVTGAAEATLRQRHAGARVLLVEDNPINQEVALALLQAVDLQVDLAGDGEQAIARALQVPYQAVLMDMQMPRLDGLGAARELRRRGFASPIIAMTANAFGEDRAACLEAGMNDHVAKPVDPEQLYVTLLRWLPGGARG